MPRLRCGEGEIRKEVLIKHLPSSRTLALNVAVPRRNSDRGETESETSARSLGGERRFEGRSRWVTVADGGKWRRAHRLLELDFQLLPQNRPRAAVRLAL